MSTVNLEILATETASMGRWVECLACKGVGVTAHLLDCRPCGGTGQVWEYALPDPDGKVRVKCREQHLDPRDSNYLAPCALVGCLGWTASDRLEDWMATVFKRWPLARIEQERLGYTFMPNAYEANRRLYYGGNPLQSCIQQALAAEGYTVHPDMAKVKTP